MATTDYEISAFRELAEYSYDLQEKYQCTLGASREVFMAQYDAGIIQLSTVWENLFVIVNRCQGGDVIKVSEDGRDFSNDGDMKVGILKRDGDKRRYVISNVARKAGTIYFVGWNWMTHQPDFYAIPKSVYGSPARGIKIMRCPLDGDVTGGVYNDYACESFEELVMR